MQQHLKNMKELTDKLAAIGAPIGEEDQVVTFLGSLPKSYATLVTAVEARVHDISLDFVQQALIHEEQKHSGETEVNESEFVLFGKSRQGKREPPMCYKCKEVGHIQYFCPLNNRSRTKPSTSAYKDHKCEKDDSDSSEGELFSERHASKAKKEMLWLIDSGASSHMTNKQEILSQFKAMKVPENVVLGDGRTVKAQGSGIVYMKMMFDKTAARKAVLYNVLYVPDLKCNLFSIRAAVGKIRRR